jgi:putative transcriptional regulator
MPRWKRPTKEEIRARRAELAELARDGDLRLPEAIVTMRRALGMSQQQFAKLFRLTRRQLAEIEGGKANPTVQTLERIGKAFGFRVGFVPSRARITGQISSNFATAAPHEERPSGG